MPFGPRRETLSPTQSYSSSSASLLGNIIPRDFDTQTAVPTTYTSTISPPINAGIVAGGGRGGNYESVSPKGASRYQNQNQRPA
ncbi:hypothetical protein PM082_012550 [Marasmius tenuissimus]|nr:hypothetical protein PM082_012550 [Marasmius tenuissimus]